METVLLTRIAIRRSMLFCCLFTLLSCLLLSVAAQAQTTTKTLKIFSPPDPTVGVVDSVLVWVHADSTVRKISASSLGSPWFYMPAFNLPLGLTVNATLTYDLYQEYVNQFTGATAGDHPPPAGQFFSSDGSTQVIAPYSRDQLVFYVTRYSNDVITVTGITNGVLSYTVNSTIVPDGSFITIIFKVKQ